MSSQMQTFQRITPILFAYIYFIVPAAAVIYMIVSSAIRILTQDLIFRHEKRSKPSERSITASSVGKSDATSDTKDDVKNDTTKNAKSDGAQPSANGSTNGSKAKQPAQPKPAPSHPRSKAKKPRKERPTS